jgi:hypothetical protein
MLKSLDQPLGFERRAYRLVVVVILDCLMSLLFLGVTSKGFRPFLLLSLHTSRFVSPFLGFRHCVSFGDRKNLEGHWLHPLGLARLSNNQFGPLGGLAPVKTNSREFRCHALLQLVARVRSTDSRQGVRTRTVLMEE